MATLSAPSPSKTLLNMTFAEVIAKATMTGARGFPSYSFSQCCGSRVINADWSWKLYEKYSNTGGWNIFEGVTDESKIPPEVKRNLQDVVRYANPAVDWKKAYVIKDTTFMLVVIGHTSAEVIEKMYSVDFLKKHKVSGYDINDPDDGLVALVWAEEKTK